MLISYPKLSFDIIIPNSLATWLFLEESSIKMPWLLLLSPFKTWSIMKIIFRSKLELRL